MLPDHNMLDEHRNVFDCLGLSWQEGSNLQLLILTEVPGLVLHQDLVELQGSSLNIVRRL